MLFDTWTREKCLEWIEHLELQVALGVTQISNPDTGTTSYSKNGAIAVITALKARLSVLDGKKRVTGFMTYLPRIHWDR